MSIPGAASPLFLTSAAPAAAAGYQISRSLRFNSADSAQLGKTFSSAGSTTTWTLSFWIKRSNTSGNQSIFMSYNGSSIAEGNYANLEFNSDGELIVGYAYAAYKHTNRVFKDFSSWYHIVVRLDTGNSTASDRVQVYVNGVKETSFKNTHDPDSGQSLAWNKAHIHRLGSEYNQRWMNGYLAEVHFVDGTALNADSFGEFDSNNVWQPKDCKDDLTYGTNGFYLDFSDNTSATTLAEDKSGNNFDWTASNINTAAGSGNDSLIDTPTNYTAASGNNGGNYPTWNPLDKNTNITLTNGNLDAAETSGSNHFAGRATFKYPATGKWYYEATVNTLGGACCIGVDNSGRANPSLANTGVYLILVNSSNNVQRYIGSSYTSFDSAYSNPAVGSVLQVAYDADADKLWLGMNNVWMGSGSSANGNPGAGTEATASSVSDPFPSVNLVTSALSVNFGQRPFAYTPPSGFKALCTTNFPTPTIADGSVYFNAKTWTGTGSSQAITGYGFSPDFAWIKSRNNTASHALLDTVRGNSNVLRSDNGNSEVTNNTSVWTSFDSDGFTLGADTSNGWTNYNNWTYVGWGWEGGSSTVSNTDGSITSSVRANQTAGFSIVTYTGNNTSGATVGHGLNAAPDFMIIKRRSGTENWLTYNRAIGATKAVFLNLTDATHSNTAWFNNTDPSSSVFTLGSGNAVNNSTGDTYLAYCFSSVFGYSSFGSYTGNGSTDGRFVYTGMRPRWVLIKKSSAASAVGWYIHDTVRDPHNLTSKFIAANSGQAEVNAGDGIDILSNGFKLRATGTDINQSGQTFVYAAFAENPFSSNGGLAR